MNHIFEYPYVIITILVLGVIAMLAIGAYFAVKSVKTANGLAEKSFCGTVKLENEYDKMGSVRQARCLSYISVSLDSMKRIYPESKAARILERIKKVLFAHFCANTDGNISVYGKSNFIALNSFNENETASLIDKCYSEISSIFTDHEAVNIVGVCFGYYITSSNEVSFKTALARAKQACSMAEDKNLLYCSWDAGSGKDFEQKIKIENNIENEIENNRFFLEYQPIIDAKTGKIMGAEVLSRLNSTTDGILTPHKFLSAVNNVGLNQKFDYYIFEKNCKWIASDKERRSNYVYTINFSRYTLCDKGFAEMVEKIIEKYDLDYSSIAVEILEDKNLTDDEKSMTVKNLARLKNKGIRVLLDDFGKGYTSFGDLSDFDISIVKIDKSITQSATAKTGFLILKNIIQTAHDLGYKTLCEGVETEEHKNAVTEAGVDIMQGYYFYRPMPVMQFEKLFEEN
ncbi:MAG: EAL domain-containing protein [Clostridia bacterium]|nr:EAL domain-containing protein [Clostridia bacterium]